MDTFVLPGEVKMPVLLKVTVRDQSAEFQHRFCSGQTPACPGQVESVCDQMTARPLYHAGRDRPSRFEHLVAAQVLEVVGQVADAGVDAVAALRASCGGLRG
ncbi:hypothetical protein [Nonomuraea sp. KM90]|uniref:hypothetical protein n=1 Tax=Nonomuraea sp. KM90 TaxID=3457428 RepID=UPI003FCE15AB